VAGFKKDEAKFSEGVYNKAIDEAKAKKHQGK